jgi:hypothetical protein
MTLGKAHTTIWTSVLLEVSIFLRVSDANLQEDLDRLSRNVDDMGILAALNLLLYLLSIGKVSFSTVAKQQALKCFWFTSRVLALNKHEATESRLKGIIIAISCWLSGCVCTGLGSA